ncbi:substrate-binding periplasmic protein [Stutzerimonas azotifigens]|uniref:substrate-binding periplasmic protein n=1 Tax=Stutzerimonas azotifigens TaxID=291995 RepID=UPI0003F4BEFA|nr:transporter substrate-binding domain-containing protein [Stutzerimonas azotifigens]
MRFALLSRFAFATFLLASPLLASAAAKCERLIATGASNNPPYLWRDPQNPERLIGANADLLTRAAEAMGLQLEVLHSGDAQAALEEVRTGRIDILADAVLVADRLDELDFIHPPILQLQTLVWAPRNRTFGYRSREDLSGLRGMVLAGRSLGSQFDAFAAERLQLRPVQGLTRALQELVTGDADYLLHERFSVLSRAEPLGLMDDIEPLEPPVLSRSMHFAVSHDSACNSAWLRGQLALKMTEFRAAGLPRQLIEENLARWTAQQLQPAGTANE